MNKCFHDINTLTSSFVNLINFITVLLNGEYCKVPTECTFSQVNTTVTEKYIHMTIQRIAWENSICLSQEYT